MQVTENVSKDFSAAQCGNFQLECWKTGMQALAVGDQNSVMEHLWSLIEEGGNVEGTLMHVPADVDGGEGMLAGGFFN
jgi:hypothetical protein